MQPPAPPEILAALGKNNGRLARGLWQLRSAAATWQLVRILLIIQAVPIIWDLIAPSAHSAPDKLSQAQILFGLKKIHFLSGDLWQLFTYSFIHGNWGHLLLNAASILLLGSKLEQIIVLRSFWLLTLYAILAGGILFLLLTPVDHSSIQPGRFHHQSQTLVGASSICFAFLVLLTTLSPESKFLPLFLSGRSIGIAIILANLMLALLNPDLPTGPLARFGQFLVQNGFPDLFKVSHACHLGGSLVGLLYGKWLLRPRVTLQTLKRARLKSQGHSE